MHKILKLSLPFFLIGMLLIGCSSSKPQAPVHSDLPENARQIFTTEFEQDNDTILQPPFALAGKGYLRFYVENFSGELGSIMFYGSTDEDASFIIDNIGAGVYDSPVFEFNADSKYGISFDDCVDLECSITVYFIPA